MGLVTSSTAGKVDCKTYTGDEFKGLIKQEVNAALKKNLEKTFVEFASDSYPDQTSAEGWLFSSGYTLTRSHPREGVTRYDIDLRVYRGGGEE